MERYDLFFTWLNYCLIRTSAYEVLRESQLSGIEAAPAKAKFADTREKIDVFELLVTGFAGVSPGARLIENCPGCGHLSYRLPEDPTEMLDLSQWDGSDFCFVWPLPKFALITERAMQVMRSAGVSGVRFVKEFPRFAQNETASPGQLNYYVPIARAVTLSGQFGIPRAPALEDRARYENGVSG